MTSDPFTLRFNCLELASSIHSDKIGWATHEHNILLTAAKLYAFCNGDLEEIPELKNKIKMIPGRANPNKSVSFTDRKVYTVDVGDMTDEQAKKYLEKIKTEMHNRDHGSENLKEKWIGVKRKLDKNADLEEKWIGVKRKLAKNADLEEMERLKTIVDDGEEFLPDKLPFNESKFRLFMKKYDESDEKGIVVLDGFYDSQFKQPNELVTLELPYTQVTSKHVIAYAVWYAIEESKTISIEINTPRQFEDYQDVMMKLAPGYTPTKMTMGIIPSIPSYQYSNTRNQPGYKNGKIYPISKAQTAVSNSDLVIIQPERHLSQDTGNCKKIIYLTY